jgi:hypothetical protein
MQPEQKINKPEELTLLYMNLGINITTNHRVHNLIIGWRAVDVSELFLSAVGHTQAEYAKLEQTMRAKSREIMAICGRKVVGRDLLLKGKALYS